MNPVIDIFEVFSKYPEYAPKMLEEVEELERLCREAGKEEIADYLFAWRTEMMYQIEAEWTAQPLYE